MLEEATTKAARKCSICNDKIAKGAQFLKLVDKSKGSWGTPAHRNICKGCQGLTIKALYLKQELDSLRRCV